MTTGDVLAVVREAARKGLRCPGNDSIDAHALRRLAAAGVLTIEVYSRNWRVVEIDGMRTAPPPFKHGKPYLVLDGTGRHEKGRSVPVNGGRRIDADLRENHPNLLPGDAKDRLRSALG